MNKRLALVVILAIGSLALLFMWTYVIPRARTADLTLAAVSEPREEVVVSGLIRNFGAAPFSLETLLIEEPGKEPYRRQVSLDAERRFELALGQPKTGTYRVAVRTRKPAWGKVVQENWLKTPDLVLEGRRSGRPRIVRAQDYDYQRLFVFATMSAVMGAVLAFVCLRPVIRKSRSRLVS